MAVTVTEIIEDGVPYRITEDLETGFRLQESIQEVPQPESSEDKIARLEARTSATEDALLALMDLTMM